MRTDKKSSNKAEKKSGLRGLRQDTMGYGKKTALLEEAITQMNAGKYGRSSAVLKELLALDPHNMEARRLFATLHLRLGSLIPARQAFDSLIDEAFERQDYWLAESLLREYLAAGPRCLPYLEKLGSIHAHKGEIVEAVTEYGKAIEILIEDPDPDNPSRASQLYKTIVDLAPVSPEALRLAGCFDAQTGEVIARPPTFHHEEGAAEESAFAVASEPPIESIENQSLPSEMSWEQVGHAEEKLDDGGSTAVEAVSASSVFPFSSVESSAVGQEEYRYNGSGEPRSDAFSDGEDTVGLESESVLTESEVAEPVSAPEFHASDQLPPITQQDAVVQEVPPPMPWEDIREETTDIPEQTRTELLDESPDVPVSDQEPGLSSQDMSKTGEFSWDSVFKNIWKSGSTQPAHVPEPETIQSTAGSVAEQIPPALAPLSMREIDPGTVEIPEAIRSQSLPGAAGESAAAPMPWDHVQEFTVTIPAAQSAVPVVESSADHSTVLLRDTEPVEASYPEPIVEQDLPQPISLTATPSVEPETSAFSFSEPPCAPPVSEPDLSLTDGPSEQSLVDDQAAEEMLESQPPEFSFAGEVAEPVEPATSLSLPEPALSPSCVEEVPADTRYEETIYSLTPESTEPPVDSYPAQPASQAEPASSLTVSDLSDWQAGDQTVQTDDPVSPVLETVSQPESEPAEATPFSEDPPVSQIEQPEWQERVVTEEWRKPDESIRFIEESQASPIAEAESPAPTWDNQDMSHRASAAAAVDVLFESSGHSTHTETRSHSTQKQPRRKPRLRLSRITGAISAFIGSCFSTTRAIVMSLIGLVVLAGLFTGLAVGAVGLIWVIMEEPPSSTYGSMTTSPQRTLSDLRKNGYLVLLGFDASMDQDPIQAGFERKPDGKDADRALACLGGSGGDTSAGQSNASAKVLNGWFKESNPIERFTSHRRMIEGWVSQAGGALSRYQQWHRLSFEDWGYGQAMSPPCAAITFAQHLYMAEGFAQGVDAGVDRIERDIEAWRIVLSQARTLPVKTLALQILDDDIAVVSGLLVQPDVEGKYLGRLARMVRPLDQNERSLRWPMQSELVSAAKTFDAKLKAEKGEEQTVLAAIASMLPLPEQRRLNRYADYYETSYRAAGEGRHGALPKWSEYIHFPAKTVLDYFTNPIENVVGLEPLAPWDLYNGLVIDTDAHLRLASLQAWIRRGPQDAELLPRIAKAGQNFYDPYTGLPMLVNLKKGVLYSVGRDGKDQDADPQADIVAAIPVNHAVAAALNASAETAKPR
ncbi:MAG TPA: tetratricopeptide repeat protein [Nitrospira sp.]|nr:tetratricopeptide repeat protein [Nitrospira sp.]